MSTSHFCLSLERCRVGSHVTCHRVLLPPCYFPSYGNLARNMLGPLPSSDVQPIRFKCDGPIAHTIFLAGLLPVTYLPKLTLSLPKQVGCPLCVV